MGEREDGREEKREWETEMEMRWDANVKRRRTKGARDERVYINVYIKTDHFIIAYLWYSSFFFFFFFLFFLFFS